ncbi:MAG: hypothetical protein Q8M40_13750 [Legionella sp.]|nr:hypothetical protein [Legionella sp.]
MPLENAKNKPSTVIYDPEIDSVVFQTNSVRLGIRQINELKNVFDNKLNESMGNEIEKLQLEAPHLFNVDVNSISNLKLTTTHAKLQNIPVKVEHCNSRYLVTVGPCDLSGVGGHQVREHIIKNLVNQALTRNEINSDYEEVNVSACVGVRGRWQMAAGFFKNNRSSDGSHMNAYIKTDGENHLTHWEPRNGPQRFFDDSICAVVVATATFVFEKGVLNNTIHNSNDATENIMKNPDFKTLFDEFLKLTENKIMHLFAWVKEQIFPLANDLLIRSHP